MYEGTMFSLHGQVAVVTGGHSWLGYDMACALAEAGCHIIIAARSAQKSETAAAALRRAYGVDALTIGMDQCDPAQVAAMADEACAWKGHVDILINNAGGGSGASQGDFLLRDPKDMERLIYTNLLGSLYCAQAIGRHMSRRMRGKIINIASIAAHVGRDRQMYRRNQKMEQPVDYAASKAGVLGMTRDLAAYMSVYNVQVNSISPGGFDKGDLPEGFVRDYARHTAQGRMGRFGSDIKGMALYLASAASDYVTGQDFVVDGGFSAIK